MLYHLEVVNVLHPAPPALQTIPVVPSNKKRSSEDLVEDEAPKPSAKRLKKVSQGLLGLFRACEKEEVALGKLLLSLKSTVTKRRSSRLGKLKMPASVEPTPLPAPPVNEVCIPLQDDYQQEPPKSASLERVERDLAFVLATMGIVFVA